MNTTDTSWQSIHKDDGSIFIDLGDMSLSEEENNAIYYHMVGNFSLKYENKDDINTWIYDEDKKEFIYNSQGSMRAILKNNNIVIVQTSTIHDDVREYNTVAQGTYKIESKKEVESGNTLEESYYKDKDSYEQQKHAEIKKIARKSIETTLKIFDQTYLESEILCIDIKITGRDLLNIATEVVYPIIDGNSVITFTNDVLLNGPSVGIQEVDERQSINGENNIQTTNRIDRSTESTIGIHILGLTKLQINDWLKGHTMRLPYKPVDQSAMSARQVLGHNKLREYFRTALKLKS